MHSHELMDRFLSALRDIGVGDRTFWKDMWYEDAVALAYRFRG
jgi:hypothetical protein